MRKIDFETKCYKSNAKIFINGGGELAEVVNIDFDNLDFDDKDDFIDYVDFELQNSKYYNKLNVQDIVSSIIGYYDYRIK